MTAVTCGRCHRPYALTPAGHRGFCNDCLTSIKTEATAAADHLTRIRSGDMRAVPGNETERQTRDDARRRQLPRSNRDCRRDKRDK